MLKNILFDLDGTLIESAPGILNSVAYALDALGVPYAGLDSLKFFIGPPLIKSFAMMGLSAADAEKAVLKYREIFAEKGIWENSLYDGVPEMLAAVQNAGFRLFLATSKPEIFARRITGHLDIDKYFEYVGGATLDKSRLEKNQVITYVQEQGKILSSTEKAASLMVGDRIHDILGAKEAGIASLAVLYGYGDRQELGDADYFADTVADVRSIIVNKN